MLVCCCCCCTCAPQCTGNRRNEFNRTGRVVKGLEWEGGSISTAGEPPTPPLLPRALRPPPPAACCLLCGPLSCTPGQPLPSLLPNPRPWHAGTTALDREPCMWRPPPACRPRPQFSPACGCGTCCLRRGLGRTIQRCSTSRRAMRPLVTSASKHAAKRGRGGRSVAGPEADRHGLQDACRAFAPTLWASTVLPPPGQSVHVGLCHLAHRPRSPCDLKLLHKCVLCSLRALMLTWRGQPTAPA